MATVTRRIGLSLGADHCWPLCYEAVMRRLDLSIPVSKKDVAKFEVERVSIEPWDLAQPVKYDVVLDRITHWYHTSREWVKKAVVANDVYVLNNPWSIQACEKNTTYAAMMRLGFPVPRTFMVPPKDYDWTADLRITLKRYAKLFDVGAVGREVGFPVFIKPYDGGAWVGVTKADDEAALRAAYEQSGKRVMHVQKAVAPFDLFVRCIGLGAETRIIRYDADQPLHARYTTDRDFMPEDQLQVMRDMTLTINAFFGWDFNSCEVLRQDGGLFPIDFANACPDSQVTSLHYHFPWLVKANVKWSVYCAATKKKPNWNLDWEPFFKIAAKDLPFREKLTQYAKIAHTRLETDKYRDFCDKHLRHVDEVVWEFFATEEAKDAVRGKVAILFPAHEVEQFTEHFWAQIQKWRNEEGRPS